MNRSNHIYDGYTQEGYVKSDFLIYNAVAFKYRPALVEERATIWDSGSPPRPLPKTLLLVAAQLEKKITEWDLKDDKGRDVPIKAKQLLQLPPNLFVALQDIVFGFGPSDINPLWPDVVKDQVEQEELVSALSGEDVGSSREKANLKN